MTWILIDLAIALVALAVLAVLLLGLWKRVKALSRVVGSAGERLATATEALEAAQAAGPLQSGATGVPRTSPVPAPVTRKTGRGHRDGRSLGASSPRRGARR